MRFTNILKYIPVFLFLFPLLCILTFDANSAFASAPGAVILNKNTTIIINKKYQISTKISETIKILSQRGINKYSEIIIPFSLKHQRVKLIDAYTLLAGRFKIKPGKHAINIITPGFAAKYPIYSAIKYFTISMPAIEKGSVIHYSFKLDTFKPIIKNTAYFTGYFNHTIPVKTTALTIIYPENMHLNVYLHDIKNSAVLNKTTHIKNARYSVISINQKNLPAIKKEGSMPPLKNYRKYIVVSAIPSWKSFNKRFYYLFKNAETSNAEMIKYVNKIAGNTKGKRNKISKIYTNFVKDFRYTGIGYGISGYKPVNAEATFSNGYGDSKALAVLLITLLKIAGIKAYPVIATSLATSNLNRLTIDPRQFDSVIITLNFANKRYFLYPDSSSFKPFNLPFALANRKALEIISAQDYRFIILPAEKPNQNKKLFKFSGIISKNGRLTGKISNQYAGLYSIYERTALKSMTHYQKTNNGSDFLYSFAPGSDIKSIKYYNIKNNRKNILLKLNFSDRNYAQKYGKKLILHQIAPFDSSLLHIVLRQKRFYPLLIGYPFEHISKIKIRIPKGYKLSYLPPALNIRSGMGQVNASCSLKGQTLICKDIFISKLVKIPATDYIKFKSLVRSYLQYLKNYYIVLSK